MDKKPARPRPGCLALAVLCLMMVLGPVLFVNILAETLVKLRLDPGWVPFIGLGIVVGSQFHIPLWSREVAFDVLVPHGLFGVGRHWGVVRAVSRQVVAINVGGGLIPGALALYELHALLQETGPPGLAVFAVILAAVVAVCKLGSRVEPSMGILMSPLFPAGTSALLALLLMPRYASVAAFSAGVLGVIVGADLLNLPAVLRVGMGIVSIGGAGTFDGILLTGILAVFLA